MNKILIISALIPVQTYGVLRMASKFSLLKLNGKLLRSREKLFAINAVLIIECIWLIVTFELPLP